MSGPPLDTSQSGALTRAAKGAGAGARRIGDIWQGLGTNGDPAGTSGAGWRAFLYGLAAIAVIVSSVNIINVITIAHEQPQVGLAAPIVWEGSSCVSFLLFAWIPWMAFRLAPLGSQPRWRIAPVHILAAVAFSFCHVVGFLALREIVYAAFGEVYRFGAFGPHFLYEFGKDIFAYLLAVAAFTLAAFVVEKSSAPATSESFYSIRDGTRIVRVPMADILAIGSAGNYVEFVLRDGRKPLMRSPLSAVEGELAPQGFLRVHRSWLVNPACMTALEPDGSGDYTVALGDLRVPLSRRFPQALAKLRDA